MFSIQFIAKAAKVCLFAFTLIITEANVCIGQYILKSYANHSSLERRVITTKHFKIVYPYFASEFVERVKPAAEQIFEAYKRLLGFEPEERITLFINNEKQFLSETRALSTGDFEPLWMKNAFFECFKGNLSEWKYLLRNEIAYAFQQKIQSSPLGLFQAFLLSSPSVPLWSAGLPTYLSVPFLTRCDVRFLKKYWNVQTRALKKNDYADQKNVTILGRSQVHFFNKIFSADLLRELYDTRKSFLGIEYFDFNYAFLQTFGVPYAFFYNQWKTRQFQIYNDATAAPDVASFTADTLTANAQGEPARFESEPYRSFFNIEVSAPIVLPYYLNTSDFGLGGILLWKSPLRLHKFLLAGILSIPAVADQSFFYTSYVNNSFGPRVKLSFKHYTSASDWLDLSVSRSNIAAASSLWKLDAISSGYSNWYAGFMLRQVEVNYFSPFTFGNSETNITFDNKFTTQTDLRLALAWRVLTPTLHNAIHPLKGYGFRFSATGSGPLLDNKTQYARFYTEAFTLIPTFGKHRVYLYAAGALDINEPIGADYLYFAADAGYELPEPKLIGSIGRAVEAYIRGYETPIAGERFLWGSVEYRIPLLLNNKLLFGVLPLPKMAFAFFADGGMIGEARTAQKTGFTAYRLSVGTELKTSLSFGGFSVAFKTGMAQALDQPFGPVFYFTIQPAIPF